MTSDAMSTQHSDFGFTGAHRPALFGTRHMAVAAHYSAAHAAFAILEAGGNAVDAGVAAGMALSVLQCDIVTFAGVAPIILWEASSNCVHTIAGVGGWPRLASIDYFRSEHAGRIPPGLRRTVVPAAPDAWITALKHFGTMTFADTAMAAERFATEGFPMYPLLADMIKANEQEYRRWPSNAEIYLPRGRPPEVGDIFVQADLGRTLRYMMDEERAAAKSGREAGLDAARNAFYKGDIASEIVKFHKANDGWLREDDLAGFTTPIEAPCHTSFCGTDVYTCGPWCQGPTLLQALNLVEPNDLRNAGHNSLDYLHTITEALKLAFADRERYYGDPRYVDVPLEHLLSTSYTAERRRAIQPAKAWRGMPPAGEWPPGASHLDCPIQGVAGTPSLPRDTSYVCVVDRWGNVFSATPSDVSFDSPVIPGTGLSPSTRGTQSWTTLGHASCLAPGKRPRLTPNPALAITPGKWKLPFGSPGGDVQCQAMLQAFLNIVVFGMDPQTAVEAPRIASYSFPDSFEPHHYLPGRLQVEGRISAEILDGLTTRGHDVGRWPDWTWRAGAVCTILANEGSNLFVGGADPRRPSYAVGW